MRFQSLDRKPWLSASSSVYINFINDCYSSSLCKTFKKLHRATKHKCFHKLNGYSNFECTHYMELRFHNGMHIWHGGKVMMEISLCIHAPKYSCCLKNKEKSKQLTSFELQIRLCRILGTSDTLAFLITIILHEIDQILFRLVLWRSIHSMRWMYYNFVKIQIRYLHQDLQIISQNAKT
jgi:hypothetical protein